MRFVVEWTWKATTALVLAAALLLWIGVANVLAADVTDEYVTVTLHTGTRVAQVGDTVNYEIKISNKNSFSLTDIVLNAPKLGIENYEVPDIDVNSDWNYPELVSYTVQESDLPGPLEVTLNVTGVIQMGEFGPDNDVNIDVTVIVDLAAIQLVKTADPSEVEEGDTVNYTFTVRNTGSIKLNEVKVTDPLLDFVDQTDALAPGEHWITEAPPYTPASDDFVGGSFTNVATVEATYKDPADEFNPGEIEAHAEATVIRRETPTPPRRSSDDPRVDLEVDKTVDDESPDVGQLVAFTITVKNLGPDNAAGVVLTDLLPDGLTYAGHEVSRGTYSETSGEWVVGSLANGSSATLILRATVDAGTAGDILTNTARLKDSDPIDENASNNSASASVMPVDEPEIMQEPEEPAEPEDTETPPTEEEPAPRPQLPVTGGSAAIYLAPGLLMLGVGLYLRRLWMV